jgi:hypothetical protein
MLCSSCSSFIAPSFVPRSHGVVSPMPKNVIAASVYGTKSSSRSDIKMMPIGVPKVAYRVPGSQQADWYVLTHQYIYIYIDNDIDNEMKDAYLGKSSGFYIYICLIVHLFSFFAPFVLGSIFTIVCTANASSFWARKSTTNSPTRLLVSCFT